MQHGDVVSIDAKHVREVLHPSLEIFKKEYLLSNKKDEFGREGIAIVETKRGGMSVRMIENPDGSLTVRRTPSEKVE